MVKKPLKILVDEMDDGMDEKLIDYLLIKCVKVN